MNKKSFKAPLASKIKNRKIRILKKARISQNLGGGFLRQEFPPVNVNAFSFAELRMPAGSGRAVISGGYSINFPTTYSAMQVESYPAQDDLWLITVYNNTATPRVITPYLITKRDFGSIG